MKSLYRRYRPVKLEEVIGQEQVTKPLMSALKAGKVGHAYIFVGPRGCGKTSVARILAHEINGFKYEIEDDYVDIIEIDGASNRGIENIRELREKVLIAPSVGKYKVYIIDEVHMLTKEAFNALLKTLEEPPAHAVFIMATTDAYKVPVTITSRAQTFTFKLADPTIMFQHLKEITEKEQIKIHDEALEIIVKRGGGSFRDSLSLLDQISTLSNEEITKEMVISALGLPEDEIISGLLRAYLGGNINEISLTLNGLLSSGIKAEILAEGLITQIVAEPKPELIDLLAKLPEVKAPYAEAKLLVALTLHKNNPGPIISTPQNSPFKSIQTKPPIKSSARSSDSAPSKLNPQDTVIRQTEKKVQDKKEPQIGSSSHVEPSLNDIDAQNDNDDSTDKQASSVPFDWNSFIEKVQELNDAVFSQVVKCDYVFNGNELKLYPKKRIVRTILARDNNKRILIEAGNGVKITICELGETPDGAVKDETLSNISAIMGGEVINDGGTSPFE